MMHRILIVALCMVPSMVSLSAMANDAEFSAKLKLAEQMHEFRPVHDQVNSAIDSIAARQPANQREAFRIAIKRILNDQSIAQISIQAMAETFTRAELEAMVAYYAKPEARSASEKYPLYTRKVQPEIVKMIDKAMMRVKTGQ